MKHFFYDCQHPCAQLRPAIGPESGILCGLCGQDVAAPIVFARLIEAIQTQQRAHNTVADFVLPRVEGAQCQRCGRVDDVRKIFHGCRTPERRALCVACLEAWLDDEEGHIEDMSVPYLARFLLFLDAGVANGNHESLARKAHDAFPGTLAKELFRQAR